MGSLRSRGAEGVVGYLREKRGTAMKNLRTYICLLLALVLCLSLAACSKEDKAFEEANALFDEMVAKTVEAYQAFLDAGIPAEDARYILPNAAETKIVVTMNIRELLHFFNLRCCNCAQWEIRDLAWKMLELARPTAPFIFAQAGPGCVRGACPEGKMTCGNPYPRVKRD